MQTLDEIRADLLQVHEQKLVCGPDYDLAIEGYPRSANTYCVGMINVLCEAAGQKRPAIGHHTHSVLNLRLAAGYGIPMLVLIRDPADAILSYKIWENVPTEVCLQRHIAFHTELLDLKAPYLLARFDEVVGDFNTVVTRLNTVLKTPLPRSRDLAADTAEVQARIKARSEAKRHGTDINLRVASPTPEREKLKAALRSEITRALADNPEPMRLYREVLARAAAGVAAVP